MRNRIATFGAALTAILAVTGAAVLSPPSEGAPPGPTVIEAPAETGRPPDRERDVRLLLDALRWNAAVERDKVQRWVAAVEENERVAAERAAAEQAEREAEQARREAAEREERTRSEAGPSYGSGACGGDLPTCAILACESGGDIHAQNPTSSASGKWQVINSTWNGYMGYPTAASAPEWVQDAFARELWAGGAGRGHWAC